MTPLPELWPALPEPFLALAGLALLMLGVFRQGGSVRPVAYLAVLAFLFAAILATGAGGGGRVVTFNGLFVMDAFGVFMKVLTLAAAALAIIMSLGYIEREEMARFEFPVLMLFATLGMMMMISANDLISLYVGLETQSLALYVIAAFRRDNARSSEAGLKYFVLGALSSCMLLYGSSLVYGFAGTTGFDALGKLLAHGHAPTGVIVGLVFIVAGLAFKVSAAPFHMWTPDVYEGAPTPVTAFFAVAPKIAAIALLIRVLVGPFGELVHQWQQVVIAASLLSMLIGAFAAIGQTNIKRLMAYSSIGNIGFALVGLAAGTEEGVRGVLIYMAIYLFMNVGAFAVILSMKAKGKMVEGIADLAGLSKTHPMMAAAMAIFMFSMAGIPPMAGFFSKLYVFLAAVDAGLYTLAIIGVLASVVGAYYYLRIIKVMYFDEPVEVFDPVADDSMTAVMAVTGLFTLLFFVLPTPVLATAARAAAALFAG